MLQESGVIYVLATAGDESLSADQNSWLAKNEFASVPVRNLNSEEIAFLIAGAAGACGVQTDYDASKISH